jgi:hypothetical protein
MNEHENVYANVYYCSISKYCQRCLHGICSITICNPCYCISIHTAVLTRVNTVVVHLCKALLFRIVLNAICCMFHVKVCSYTSFKPEDTVLHYFYCMFSYV